MTQPKKSIELSEIIQAMREVRERLDVSSKEIFRLAKNKAEAEKRYRIALRGEILKLKQEKMSATQINDVAKGSEYIAQLRYERDVAKELYGAGRDSMNNTRVEASLLQTISRYQSDM